LHEPKHVKAKGTSTYIQVGSKVL